MTVSKDTAMDIAFAYREIDVAQELLLQISEAMARREEPDIRDAFGRRQTGLELSIPISGNSRRLFNVPWNLAKPIIETHIAKQKAMIEILSEKAKAETVGTGEPVK